MSVYCATKGLFLRYVIRMQTGLQLTGATERRFPHHHHLVSLLGLFQLNRSLLLFYLSKQCATLFHQAFQPAEEIT